MALPLAAIPAILQGGIGLAQLIGGAATKTPDRPQYAPPAALSEMVSNANREASASMMPGQVQAQQQVRTNSANAINNVQQNATSSSQMLNAIGAVQLGENRSLTDLYLQSLSFKDRARMRQQQALSGLAQAQNQAFQTNQMQPYEQALATKSALFGAGMQTTGDALGGLGAIFQANQLQRNKPTGIDPSLGIPMGDGSAFNNLV
jgi:hypothetical protein